ncbi:hypothetical protein ABHI18_009234, partial [Aspergillus niger]
ILVDRIEGGFDNVVGLPLKKALWLMERVVVRADDEDLLDGEAGDEDLEEEEGE